MSRLLAVASLIAIAASPALAHDPVFDTDRLSLHVRTLSSDAYEGRGPNTAGEDKAVGYISGALAAAGIQPGGQIDETGRRSWTQDVILARSTIVDQPLVTLTIGGEAVQLTQGEQIAVRAPINGDAQTQLNDTPLLFVGYGTDAPERGWSDFKDVDVAGKIIVVLVNDPDFEGGEGDFGGKEMTYYGRWTYKYEEAARRGAAGVMIIHEDAPASYGWATVRSSNNTTYDIVRDNPKAAHTGFESWIHRDLAEQLFAASGTTLSDAKAKARRKDFQPMLLNATLDAAVLVKNEQVVTKNVVGIIPGTERPDETVIYSAHYDHLGIGEPDANGDAIYNGALDNATGIAMLLEQARAFAGGMPKKRSVVFLAVGAEEKGLLGATYYAANPLYPLAKTAGVINTDSQSVFGRARDFTISGTAKLELLDMLVEEGAKMGKSYSPDPRPEAGGFFRSDHFAFAQAGVPAISFKAGQDMEEGGVERAREIAANYTAKYYHQPDDEWSADWNFEGIAQDGVILHHLGERLANSDAWPNWSATSEFRAVRDASAADRSGD